MPTGEATIDVDCAEEEELTQGNQKTSSPPAKLQIPRQLGPYRIVSEIARGGMGVVLRGHHEVLARDVAIKLLLPTAKGDRECFERFLLEAKATARLRHPGIVAIHDVARDPEGTPYLVMDLIEGETLRERIRKQGALAPREVAEIMGTVAEAVAHAHEQGILHRDLKHDNVILDQAGRPHLTDFGLAKLVQQDAPAGAQPEGRLLGAKLEMGLTNEGAVMGTPRFMSPEQVRGHTLTVAADIWALGVMLYEALTGKAPFMDKTVIGIFERIIKQDPTPPSQINPLIPARLERICLRCLQKDPSERPGSAAEVARELRLELEAAQRPIRTAAPPPAIVDGSGVVRTIKVGTFVLGLLAIPLIFGPLRGSWEVPSPGATVALAPTLPAGGLEALQRRAEAGEARAMASYGELLLRQGEPEEGVDFLERAAEAGEGRACLILGQAFEAGTAGEEDAEVALEWYREGIEAGADRCLVAAGLVLARQLEPEARSEARELLEAGLPAVKAERATRRVCLTELGRLHLQVEPTDVNQGLAYLQEAAGLGSTAAMVDLVRLLEEGELVPRDDEAAYVWLRQATSHGDATAWIELGDVLAAGRLGQAQDADLAREAYERARSEHPELVEARLERIQ